MFRQKRIVLSAVFLICTLLIFYLSKFFSSLSSPHSFREAFVVAKYELKKGDLLTMENTTVVFLDLGKAHSKFVRNVEFNDYEGLSVRTAVEENLPILKKNLVTFEETQDRIPVGKRLFKKEENNTGRQV